MAKISCVRNFFGVLQSVAAAALLYVFLYSGVLVFQRGSFPKSPVDLVKNPVAKPSTDNGTPMIPNKLRVEKINPHANWFNRPESMVTANDDYLGKRPHINTVANLTRLVEMCRGSYENIEKMPYVQKCMKYMAEKESEYYYVPPAGEGASEQPPKLAEYLNSDGNDNTLAVYPAHKPATKETIGKCNGPIVPYHVYWAGPATWRVELFIKSHLYTQNIPCVRLFLWLDGDRDPKAAEKMPKDPLFQKFMPFVERGDITIMTWKFPSRIPLPKGDNTDGVGYYKIEGRPNSKGEYVVGDGLIRDARGQEWLVLSEKQKTFLPVAVSDAVRFVVLHQYGGAYFDMDVIMLRDMRPLLIGEEHSFAERWGGHPSPGDYNTAVMSLTANSSLSSYLLRGGVRMGLNFHPRIIGVMAVKDGRNFDFNMLETAAFDPIWTEFNWGRLGQCTVPCIHDYGQVFKGNSKAFPLKDEWEAYEGELLGKESTTTRGHFWDIKTTIPPLAIKGRAVDEAVTYDRDALSKMEYKIEEDRYPPTNRTVENFFRGSWTYHVHNQWSKNPEPSSWLNVIQRAQDGFFLGGRMNPYGEEWNGPSILPYEISWEYA
ncbi:snoRNA binding protein-like protein [Calycina marina]|uniref:SnoRNA binding protein-like protein n=1 Tax=Calycina marina TaxID=1763456 RepID=A0A9P7Z6T6_9HELO|nr:snoRNA binding protein-like protein [Calycina marina]